MIKSIYNQYQSENVTLRDQLAIERTALANERTFLSYIRTLVGLVAVGGTLFKLSTHWITTVAAIMLLIVGFFVILLGIKHFLQATEVLKRLQQQEDVNPDFTHKIKDWLTI